MRRLIAVSLVALLLAVILYMVATRVFISEEARIEKQIQRGRKAIEDESILTIALMVAEDYRDESGNDRSTLLAQVRHFFQVADNLKLGIRSVNVTVADSEAEALIRFTISGMLSGESFAGLGSTGPESARLRFSRRSGSWQVVEAAWGDHKSNTSDE